MYRTTGHSLNPLRSHPLEYSTGIAIGDAAVLLMPQPHCPHTPALVHSGSAGAALRWLPVYHKYMDSQATGLAAVDRAPLLLALALGILAVLPLISLQGQDPAVCTQGHAVDTVLKDLAGRVAGGRPAGANSVGPRRRLWPSLLPRWRSNHCGRVKEPSAAAYYASGVLQQRGMWA